MLNQTFQNPRHIGVVSVDLIGQQNFVAKAQQPQVVMLKRHHRHHGLIERADAHFSQQRFLITVGKPGGAALA